SAVHAARRPLRHLRVDGAHGAAALLVGGACLSDAVRGGRRALADPLAREPQPQVGVPARGHPHAPRRPGDPHRAGPLAPASACPGLARGGACARWPPALGVLGLLLLLYAESWALGAAHEVDEAFPAPGGAGVFGRLRLDESARRDLRVHGPPVLAARDPDL